MVSPSALGGCPRALILERTTDFYQEPGQLYWAVRGSLIHGFLESSANVPGVIAERRLFKTVTDPETGRTFTLSGRFDYMSLTDKTLEDYKTIQDKSIDFIFNKGAKEDHVKQTNVYRWLMHGGHLDSLAGEQVWWDIHRIQVHYMTLAGVYSTGTTFQLEYGKWQLPKKTFGCETERKVIGQDKRGNDRYGITVTLPEVPLMDWADVEAHIFKYGPELAEAFEQDPYDIRAVLHDDDRNWQCRFCGPRPSCELLESQRNRPVKGQMAYVVNTEDTEY
jgi:hypothetical protein